MADVTTETVLAEVMLLQKEVRELARTFEEASARLKALNAAFADGMRTPGLDELRSRLAPMTRAHAAPTDLEALQEELAELKERVAALEARAPRH